MRKLACLALQLPGRTRTHKKKQYKNNIPAWTKFSNDHAARTRRCWGPDLVCAWWPGERRALPNILGILRAVALATFAVLAETGQRDNAIRAIDRLHPTVLSGGAHWSRCSHARVDVDELVEAAILAGRIAQPMV